MSHHVALPILLPSPSRGARCFFLLVWGWCCSSWPSPALWSSDLGYTFTSPGAHLNNLCSHDPSSEILISRAFYLLKASEKILMWGHGWKSGIFLLSHSGGCGAYTVIPKLLIASSILILLRPESSGWPILSAPSVLPANLRFFPCVRLDSPKTNFQGINLAARFLGAELGKGSWRLTCTKAGPYFISVLVRMPPTLTGPWAPLCLRVNLHLLQGVGEMASRLLIMRAQGRVGWF